MSAIVKTIFAIVLCCTLPLHEANAKQLYAPWKDEAKRDASFLQFRTRLLQAIAEHDTDYVVSVSSSDVYVSHGGNGGHEELRQMLNIPEELLSDEYKAKAPQMRDEIWGDFKRMMLLGGVFTDKDTFAVPYTEAFNLPESYDAYETLFVTGTSVLMRSGPSQSASVIARLNYHVVSGQKTSDIGEPGDYSQIRLQNGTTGYVHNDFLRSPVGYRAYFHRGGDGKWTMGIFVAGD